VANIVPIIRHRSRAMETGMTWSFSSAFLSFGSIWSTSSHVLGMVE
jgi:hypothetical protein